MHVFRLWEETEAPGENPHRRGQNMQTPDFFYEAAVLTTQNSQNKLFGLMSYINYGTVFSVFPYSGIFKIEIMKEKINCSFEM